MSRTRFAGLCWTLEVVVFVGHVIAQLAWTAPYNIFGYAISDLGAVTCYTDPDSGFDICSPAHLALNVSLIAAGVFVVTGALLLPLSRRRRGLDRLSRAFLVIGGLGCACVGLVPQDVALPVHAVGAFAVMLGGNIGLMLFGIALMPRRRVLGEVAAALGVLGLLGIAGVTIILVTGSPDRYVYGGLVERVAAFSLLLGQVVVGVSLLRRPAAHSLVSPKHPITD